MDTDLFLIIGLVLGALAIPSIAAAFSEGRAPRAAMILILIAGVLVVVALTNKPGGYAVDDIPQVFFSVIGRVLN